MISLLKIVFTIGVIYAVWFVFKYRTRIAAAHKTVMAEKARAQARAAAETATRAPGTPLAQDLVPCPKCGSYIAQGARCSCEKV
jgi:hypothetical protein